MATIIGAKVQNVHSPPYRKTQMYPLETAIAVAEELHAFCDEASTSTFVVLLHASDGWVEQMPADLARERCTLYGLIDAAR